MGLSVGEVTAWLAGITGGFAAAGTPGFPGVRVAFGLSTGLDGAAVDRNEVPMDDLGDPIPELAVLAAGVFPVVLLAASRSLRSVNSCRVSSTSTSSRPSSLAAGFTTIV